MNLKFLLVNKKYIKESSHL